MSLIPAQLYPAEFKHATVVQLINGTPILIVTRRMDELERAFGRFSRERFMPSMAEEIRIEKRNK